MGDPFLIFKKSLVSEAGGMDEYFKLYPASCLMVWKKPEAFPLKTGVKEAANAVNLTSF